MHRWGWIVLGCLMLFGLEGHRPANAAELVYRCLDVKGTLLAPPSWVPQIDGFKNASVLLRFTGDGGESIVKWSNAVDTYKGIGVAINGGFMIILIGEQFNETYVVNVSNLDLLFTAIRSGSQTLPNSAKAFRGVCAPAGHEVR